MQHIIKLDDDWEPIFDGNLVDRMIVNTRAPTIVFSSSFYVNKCRHNLRIKPLDNSSSTCLLRNRLINWAILHICGHMLSSCFIM